jgi:hypothetical protein
MDEDVEAATARRDREDLAVAPRDVGEVHRAASHDESRGGSVGGRAEDDRSSLRDGADVPFGQSILDGQNQRFARARLG